MILTTIPSHHIDNNRFTTLWFITILILTQIRLTPVPRLYSIIRSHPSNPVHTHPNSYQPESSSSSSSRPLEYQDPNQQHHCSSGHRCHSHQESMPQANFPRRHCCSNNDSTNHHSYHQHESSRRRSNNDSITHHFNHQHDFFLSSIFPSTPSFLW